MMSARRKRRTYSGTERLGDKGRGWGGGGGGGYPPIILPTNTLTSFSSAFLGNPSTSYRFASMAAADPGII